MGLGIVEHKAVPAELRSAPVDSPPAAIFVSDPKQLVETVHRKFTCKLAPPLEAGSKLWDFPRGEHAPFAIF